MTDTPLAQTTGQHPVRYAFERALGLLAALIPVGIGLALVISFWLLVRAPDAELLNVKHAGSEISASGLRDGYLAAFAIGVFSIAYGWFHIRDWFKASAALMRAIALIRAGGVTCIGALILVTGAWLYFGPQEPSPPSDFDYDKMVLGMGVVGLGHELIKGIPLEGEM